MSNENKKGAKDSKKARIPPEEKDSSYSPEGIDNETMDYGESHQTRSKTAQDLMMDTMSKIMEQMMQDKKEQEEKRLQHEQDMERRRAREIQELQRQRTEEDARRMEQTRALEEMRLKHEKACEEQRMNFERELHRQKTEEEAKRQQQKDKLKLADKMTAMKDADGLESYLRRFTETMEDAEIPRQEWPKRLRPLLTGTALAAYSNNVEEDKKGDWDQLREALLKAMGSSAEQCRIDFFGLQKRHNDTWQETSRKISFHADRMVHDCETKEEVNNTYKVSKMLSLCPVDALNFVMLKEPKKVLEVANLIDDFTKRQE